MTPLLRPDRGEQPGELPVLRLRRRDPVSCAAVVVVAIRWPAAEEVAERRVLTFALLAVVTLGITALAVRTGLLLRRGTYLPRMAAGSSTGIPDAVLDGSSHPTDASPRKSAGGCPRVEAGDARRVPQQAERGPGHHGRDHER